MADNDLCQHHETSDNVGATPVQRDNGKPPKGGAPRGNRNAVKHGGRSSDPAMCVGAWGPRHYHAMRMTLRFRRWLIAEVEAAFGLVGPMAAVWIDAACQADMAIRVIRKNLATAKPGELTAKDEADLVGRIMNYSTVKQRAIGKLRLQTDQPRDPWSAVDEILSQEPREADGDDSGDDDSEDGPDGECTGDEEQGDGAADSETTDPWEECDREIERLREAEE